MPLDLKYGSSFGHSPNSTDLEASLEKTAKWWKNWISKCTYHGPGADAVERSLITLKALTYNPTGGILAAATTSLPEEFGGKRNWDYRYCWLRDATFSLLALVHAGYHEEARRWRDWLLRAAAGSADQMQIMYGVAAERRIPEREIPWLPGYKGASPVRIGNAAAEQLQLDIYGEIADALHQAPKGSEAKSEPTRNLQRELLRHLQDIWREPDHGIWEVRGPTRHFTHSKVMAWVAFDRAIKDCQSSGADGDLDRWRATRQEIHDDACRRGFDAELGTFVQSYGSKQLDASLLLIPLVGFLPPSDPRIAGTIRQIERRLIRDGLVMRYDTEKSEDGLPSGEGAFLACSLWLADAYHLLGQNDKARDLLERVLRLRNDVGLLSEEYDPEEKRFAGNFPQAFSHVGLVNTIINLNMPTGPARQRSGSHGHSPKPPL
ncbi:MAG TPA: glycoside hydrolase family 15 protein [Candidatus Acidoferrales bacterium]